MAAIRKRFTKAVHIQYVGVAKEERYVGLYRILLFLYAYSIRQVRFRIYGGYIVSSTRQ